MKDKKPLLSWMITPYAELTIRKFKSAKDKLMAMSTEANKNRMKVGECIGIGVQCCIYRKDVDRFDIYFEDRDQGILSGLTSEQVVKELGEHDILEQEMFEIPTVLESVELKKIAGRWQL